MSTVNITTTGNPPISNPVWDNAPSLIKKLTRTTWDDWTVNIRMTLGQKSWEHIIGSKTNLPSSTIPPPKSAQPSITGALETIEELIVAHREVIKALGHVVAHTSQNATGAASLELDDFNAQLDLAMEQQAKASQAGLKCRTAGLTAAPTTSPHIANPEYEVWLEDDWAIKCRIFMALDPECQQVVRDRLDKDSASQIYNTLKETYGAFGTTT